MAVEIRMPKMGLTMSTAEVVKWLKKEGDPVAKGDALAEVMTDKITNQVESPAPGVLLKIVAAPGARMEAGGLMAFVGQAGEPISDAAPAAPAASAEAAAPAPAASAPAARPAGGRVAITPVARKLAEDNGLDVNTLTGTGPGGRITREDVEAALAAGPAAPAPAAPAAPAPADEVLRRVPYAGMRQAIGRNMHKSWSEIPRVTLHTTVKADALLELRKSINARLEPMDKVSVTDLLIKLIGRAVAAQPGINALFDGREITVMKHVNLGVAVALDDGLVVPVIRRVEEKSLQAVSRELKDLADRAKRGGLKLDEMSGGTLTVSNLGGSGAVDHFSPIINPPQAAIIGVGRARQAVVAENGEPAVATVLSLSVTHDHRVLDGAPVAAFMAALNTLIEDPLPGIV